MSSFKGKIPDVVCVFTTHKRGVHASLTITSHNLAGTELVIPMVAVLGIVKDVAAVRVRVVKSPVPAVAFLNVKITGSLALGSAQALVLIAIVSALPVLDVTIV